MTNWVNSLIDFLKELIRPLSVAISSFIVYQQGRNAQAKIEAEKKLEDAKKAKNLRESLNSLPDSDIDNFLR